MVRTLFFITALVTLVSCDTIYRSSYVVPGADDGTNVRVVPMTAETVVQANKAPFTPQTLPAVFSVTAGNGSGLRSGGQLPSPTFEEESRPPNMELRIPPTPNPGPYAIGIGDVVLLSTPTSSSSVAELSGLLAAQNSREGYTVQDDGAINIPNVGRVRIAGMTIEDAEAELFQRLVENQIDPMFSLEIAEFNSRRISIGGAVANPTIVPVGLSPLYLDEALAAAGGITVEDQDFASVRLYRDGTLYQIPLMELYSQTGLLRTRLVDGDAIFVDTDFYLDRAAAYFEQQIALVNARQSTRAAALDNLESEIDIRRNQLDEQRTNFQTRVDLGADDREYVYLLGELRRQTRFPLPYENRAHLADALLAESSGIQPESGDVSQIYVLRASDNPREFGAVTAWHLDARNAANFALMARFELRPDDIVFIAQQPITRWNRAISQLLPSVFSFANVAVD